jgi:hypothetical protein
VFVEPGSHSGALNAHDVNADVALGLSIVAAVYAIVLLRKAARSLVIGSLVLVALLVALVAIGHAITRSGDNGLTSASRAVGAAGVRTDDLAERSRAIVAQGRALIGLRARLAPPRPIRAPALAASSRSTAPSLTAPRRTSASAAIRREWSI